MKCEHGNIQCKLRNLYSGVYQENKKRLVSEFLSELLSDWGTNTFKEVFAKRTKKIWSLHLHKAKFVGLFLQNCEILRNPTRANYEFCIWSSKIQGFGSSFLVGSGIFFGFGCWSISDFLGLDQNRFFFSFPKSWIRIRSTFSRIHIFFLQIRADYHASWILRA